MNLFRLAVFIFTEIFIGWNILYLTARGRSSGLSYLEKLFISYGLGLGFTSLEMFTFHFLNIGFNLAWILAPWLLLSIVNLINYFHVDRTPGLNAATPKVEGYKVLKVFLIFGITFEVIYALFRALIRPIESYDAVAIYAMKAKIFYLAGSIPRDFFHNLALVFAQPDYPLNIPLSQALCYLFLGNINDQLVKIIFPLYFIGIIGLLYFAIRRFASQNYALLFTFILASIPQFNAYASNAYLEVPLAYYYFASAMFLFRWFEDRSDRQFLLISALMLALACWTKNEGLMYCIVNMLVIVLYFILERAKLSRKDILSMAIYPVIVFILLSGWLWVKKSEGLVNKDLGPIGAGLGRFSGQFYKIGPIAYEFQKQFFGPKKWNIIWPLLVIAFIFNYKEALGKIGKYITISLFLAVAGYVFFYLIAQIDVRYFLSKSWSRFLLHFLPLTVYWLAYLLKEDVKI